LFYDAKANCSKSICYTSYQQRCRKWSLEGNQCKPD
jgi:hypothetical protein